MRIHLLDMGKNKFGDCLVVTHGDRAILIDGAHRGDSNDVAGQLEAVLGHGPPFAFDLLVVTHCHDDHIGQLPELVEDGTVTADVVLAADEKLGWGRDADNRSPVDAKGLSDGQRALVAALLEEDHSDLPGPELEQFLQDARKLEDRYADMLKKLAAQGARVVRYGRSPARRLREVEAAFADFGLKILGPTPDHLIRCAHVIAQGSDALADAVVADGVAADAGPGELARRYRRLAGRQFADAAFAADRAGPSAAKNDQSIVLKVEADGWAALLAGDMQFADPEVAGLDDDMAALRRRVADAGPYAFVKLTHHTSYNAVDESVLDEYAGTALFAHTGGRNDATHPDPDVLALLKARRAGLKFARTDRNGRITVEKSGAAVAMTVSRGRLNDFTPNREPDEPEPAAEQVEPAEGEPVRVRPEPAAAGSGDVVEVIARVPHQKTTVTLTIRVEPGEGTAVVTPPPPPPGPADAGELRLGGGRPLPRLAFVTCRPRLEANVGRLEAERVFRALARTPGARVIDLPAGVATAEEAARVVRPALAAGPVVGVVVLGGYDVVPAHKLDVLDAAARRAVEDAGRAGEDADDFVVWSDELYGDRDGDFMPELPVTRVPDGRRADVVFAALAAPAFAAGRRFGVRNYHRPFAADVFPGVPGGGRLEVSESFGPEAVPPGAAAGAVYYMLHGSDRDATRFWGETAGGSGFEAVSVENVPDRAAGSVVFTGCCWGALAMGPIAAKARPGTPLRPRGPEASLAVAYLRAGALAFVGCTGSHYSPREAPYDYFGKPLHDAFWAALARGKPPAEALFLAKGEFARRVPHGMTDAFSRAVEVKLLRQFTCLGLGW